MGRNSETPSCSRTTLTIETNHDSVTVPEPLPDGHILYSLPNVILTPHSSWASLHNFHRACELLKVNVGILHHLSCDASAQLTHCQRSLLIGSDLSLQLGSAASQHPKEPGQVDCIVDSNCTERKFTHDYKQRSRQTRCAANYSSSSETISALASYG